MQRARPVHRGHRRLPAGLHRAVRQQGRQLQRLQGLRHAPDGAPRVRQLRLQLPRAPASVLPRRAPPGRARSAAPRAWSPRRSWLTDMERFFDLFPERQMASDLFTIVEDLRIDARVHEEYGGIRRASRQVQERELRRRPEMRTPAPAQGLRREPDPRQPRRRGRRSTWPKPLRAAAGRGAVRRCAAAQRRGDGRRRGRGDADPLRARRADAQPAAGDAARTSTGTTMTEEQLAGAGAARPAKRARRGPRRAARGRRDALREPGARSTSAATSSRSWCSSSCACACSRRTSRTRTSWRS